MAFGKTTKKKAGYIRVFNKTNYESELFGQKNDCRKGESECLGEYREDPAATKSSGAAY